MQRHFFITTVFFIVLALWETETTRLCAQNHTTVDTTKTYQIDDVVVIDHKQTANTRSTTPLQQLTEQNLKTTNALQIADGLKTMSGVNVKDYGGIGGLKSVSVRSLGASHTAVSYDGVGLSDAQTGQIDIGRFSLDNVQMVSISNGQSDQIFQPARQYASAALLNIQTKVPTFDSIHSLRGMATIKGGSFGLFNPALLLSYEINKTLSWSNSVEWMSANGAYPYKLDYGTAGIDSTSNEHRKNSDVQNLRVESTLFANDSIQQGSVKLYYYQSERGLPGATIFYNTDNFSSQRIWDRTFFAQGHYLRTLSTHFNLQLNAKYNYASLRYLDPAVNNTAGKEDQNYTQQEGYLSGGVLYNCIPGLQFMLSTDGIINTLTSNVIDQATPTRYTWLTALAAKYLHQNVTAMASLLSSYIHDEVQQGQAAKDYYNLSPYVGLSVRPTISAYPINISLRAFYKNVVRMPSFNDLYYGRVGNRNLKPESTNQFNLGFTYSQRITSVIPQFSLTCDAYHNQITNKIVAYPSKNLFTWTMLNYGKVAINGIDINGQLVLEPIKSYRLLLAASYTYQRALNVTDPDSREYKHQIPYTPRVSGSGQASIDTPWFTLAYNIIWSGHRYAVNQNYAENRLPGYTDQSLSLAHDFPIKRGNFWVNIACMNLANQNYCVVRYFPMPGRSWRATISYSF